MHFHVLPYNLIDLPHVPQTGRLPVPAPHWRVCPFWTPHFSHAIFFHPFYVDRGQLFPLVEREDHIHTIGAQRGPGGLVPHVQTLVALGWFRVHQHG